MGPMRNCVALGGFLVACIGSANAEVQTQAPAEPSTVRSENTDQSAGLFRAAPMTPDDIGPTKIAASGVRTCACEGEGEVVVCARPDDEGYRLKPLTDKYEHKSFLGKTLDIPITRGIHLYGLGIRVAF